MEGLIKEGENVIEHTEDGTPPVTLDLLFPPKKLSTMKLRLMVDWHNWLRHSVVMILKNFLVQHCRKKNTPMSF